MRTYFDLIQHLKTTFEEDVNVSTVVTEGYPDIDHWKKNVFPLVDVNVLTDDPTESTALTRFSVEITVLDIRDKNKEQVNDKFYRNDNRHDNWNLTHAILKRGRNKLLKDHLDTDITLQSYTAATRIVYQTANLLDGWQQTFTIDVPDDYTTVCTLLDVVSGAFDNAATTQMTEFVITWTDAIAGYISPTVAFYDSGDSLVEAFTTLDMTLVDNIVTVDVTGGMLVAAGAGEYYAIITENSFTGIGQGNLEERIDVTITA